jgi:hypothetical protein
MRIPGGGPKLIAETSHGMNQIGSRDDANYLVVFDDRNQPS